MIELRHPISIALIFGALAAGCSEPGPDMLPVSGSVTLNGKPFGGATISFWSDVHVAAATTDADGRYQLDPGAVPGDYKVTVTDYVEPSHQPGMEVPPDMLPSAPRSANRFTTIPAKYARGDQTVLSITVAEPGTDSANFDLTVP